MIGVNVLTFCKYKFCIRTHSCRIFTNNYLNFLANKMDMSLKIKKSLIIVNQLKITIYI